MMYPTVLKQGQHRLSVFLLLAALGSLVNHGFADDSLPVSTHRNDRLEYRADLHGNRVPDFSHCGYAGAQQAIPDAPVRITVAPADGDDSGRIQAAIDHVANLPLDGNGFRGAVFLHAGRFEVAGQLRIATSGIILRGSGAGPSGTLMFATGPDRRVLLRIEGKAAPRPKTTDPRAVVDDYVPVGADTLQLDSTTGLHPGQTICITRPSTAEWIKALGMDAFGVGWKPGTRNIAWERTITRINNAAVTLDAPLTTAVEKRFGGAVVSPVDRSGRISNVGIEHLQLVSEHNHENRHDEEHAWFGVTMDHVENAWVRCVEFRHFAGGAVALWENARKITVEDCVSLHPVSEVAGYRRHTFFTQGQQTLFLRCWSKQGRHDFAVGHCAPGPNAFVNCFALEPHSDSGPIESWASGVLYDNVRIEGNSLGLENRWAFPPGTGWSAANCLLWQCQAATIRVFDPPTAANWAIGAWAEFAGNGQFAARSEFVDPISLYHAQLRERRGASAAAEIVLGLVDPIGSTNPSLAEAARFTTQSKTPAPQLIDLVRERFESQKPATPARTDQLPTSDSEQSPSTAPGSQKLSLQDGWLVDNGRLMTGGLQQQGFWRGTIRPGEAPQFGPAITRFVPGRHGTGFTDDLSQVADHMQANDVAVFEHHYGLWYDRRRDDHTMVRRQNGNVAPPFYEQPFARTGNGKAWDGMSKYDLTRFNPWYWRRLRDFADLCRQRGLVLFHQNYFQHNILEAGAHWADCPWRPANNVNDTGFPEPPPYVGDKRIFLASQFYDVTNPQLRVLHRDYIRQCLDNFKDCPNVVQLTSAEYSGPLEFTQFWLDTIVEWMRENQRDVIVALSAPKDVQDAILADPQREPHVDLIDIRYWAYASEGELYAPRGGTNLAPRQHLRQTRLRPGGFGAIARAVREYRIRFPDKAVTYYADVHCPSRRDGWAVLMGGGSLPNVELPDSLARTIPSMAPSQSLMPRDDAWCLANDRGDYLLFVETADQTFQVNLPDNDRRYRVHWLDPKTNRFHTEPQLAAGPELHTSGKANVVWLELAPAR